MTQLEVIENDAVTAPSRFLFVNGTLTSKSLSEIESPALRPAINRHVQRWSFETKGRKKQQTSVGNAAKRHLGQKRKQSANEGAAKAKLDVVWPKTPTSSPNQGASTAKGTKLPPCIWSDGNYLDPFASTDIQVDAG